MPDRCLRCGTRTVHGKLCADCVSLCKLAERVMQDPQRMRVVMAYRRARNG